MAQDNHNSAGFTAVVGSIVFTLAFMVYIALIHPGVSLDENKPASKEEVKK